ncbi:hypothetical protein AGABI1DRAFT_112388 [Agaricus bisporus var. burnettii JB137-S8]|uniref:Uncharacterized protein n=2 Tax=Agaricus bisporus var. burnettii TaxID=192524 RepID=K5W1I4_AGABU|nr:uncharacterized protein AGABI1DRAFT_112388 [Agaricus bisporus var. burnettii JB137-S8]EKM80629.1 hypothetical protein AGABI1DRAFT_112388 [Agaricus bisporus var. burnettii JB137-S8]KAF7782266.1 hypothetical protein Agabi119p4_1642 [Agaricus bisporus var. burnettii]
MRLHILVPAALMVLASESRAAHIRRQAPPPPTGIKDLTQAIQNSPAGTSNHLPAQPLRRQFHNADFSSSGNPPTAKLESPDQEVPSDDETTSDGHE